MQIVDRRLNPKAKSLGNRQRFMRRAKAEIREAVRKALKKRKISEVEESENISISSKSLREPSFSLGRASGKRDFVLPGNQDFSVGDKIQKPPQGGGGGRKASADGSGEDDFIFSLTKEEFLDIFFEDLKLPNLVKAKLKSVKSHTLVRAGLQSDGSPAKLNRGRTMRNSLARRIALHRPGLATIKSLEDEIEKIEAETPVDEERLETLRARLRHLQHMRRTVPYIDPLDLRYNRHERLPKPTTQAVMFCLMDVSGSMTESLKDLAKRFFMLLNVFLNRHYQEVDIVFIRHTSEAQEVEEDQFFHDTSTGGTVISTALEEMDKVIKERYPVDDWNIYGAQASDGDNIGGDMAHCVDLLERRLLPHCQYFAYIEVGSVEDPIGGNTVVWTGYHQVAERHRNFAMRRVADPGEIYPVFRDLFAGAGDA
jgi:uncharacterized protein